MKKSIGGFLAGAAFCLAFGIFSASSRAQENDIPAANGPPIALSSPATTELVPLSAVSPKASSHKTIKHKSTHRHRKHGKKSRRKSAGGFSGHTNIRAAQVMLSELGYNPGSADGVAGPRTKSATKAFQRDHHLRADGIIGSMTYDALVRESGSKNPVHNSEAPPANFYATHPDFYGYYGADYANPTVLAPSQPIPSRFGSMEIDDQQSGQTHQYAITLNGQNLFHAENQPAPINVSRTFNLNGSDAILVTSYANGNSVCPYMHHLLVVRPNGSNVRQIDNCTRDYEAYTEDGNLIIHFPEGHANTWTSGAMWRYENGTLAQF